MKKIVVTGEKGGVGKSTITCLLTEWLLHNGHTVRVVDADPNETTREWVENCAREGRTVSIDSGAEFQIVDTAGRSGGGLKFVADAHLILAPFQPLAADVSRVAAWFMALHPRLQEKVAFVPNRLRAAMLTIEERAGLLETSTLIDHEGNGFMIRPGLFNRIAVYPPIFDGSNTNFFDGIGSASLEYAKRETAHVAVTALRIIQKMS
jgi:hypothetical protein